MIASWSISNLSSTSTTPWFVTSAVVLPGTKSLWMTYRSSRTLTVSSLAGALPNCAYPYEHPRRPHETGQQDEAAEGVFMGAVYRNVAASPAGVSRPLRSGQQADGRWQNMLILVMAIIHLPCQLRLSHGSVSWRQRRRTAARTSSSDGKPKAVFCATRIVAHPRREFAARAFDELRLDARVLLNQRRHTGGARTIVSDLAVANPDGRHFLSPRRARRSGSPGGRSCLRGTRTRTPAACRLSSGSSRTSRAASTCADRRAWPTSRPSSGRSA